MRPATPKRAKVNRAYSALRRVFLAAHRECEIVGPTCTHHATEVHHVVKRSQAHWLIADRRVFAASCHNCNMRVEAEPAWARENGWTVRSMVFPEYEPAECPEAVDGHIWVEWNGHLVREEWLIAGVSQMIGPSAPYDAIQHRNGDVQDNRLANFMVAPWALEETT